MSGTELYRVSQALEAVKIGDIPGTGYVSMVHNNTQVLIVTNGELSFSADDDGVSQVPETSLVSAAYQDGYGIAIKRGSEQFYHSGVDDMTTWNALAFSSADALADDAIALVSVQRRLWVMGARTIERWYNFGGSPFSFQREQGGFVEIGCLSPYAPAVDVNRVIWIGHDFRVYMSAGGPPQEVSTSSITRLIEGQSDAGTAQGYIYNQDGHTFYVIGMRDLTLVYDMSTGLWHHRISKDLDRWRAQCHEWVWGKNIVGDYETGRIYELDLERYNELSDESYDITQFSEQAGGLVRITQSGVNQVVSVGQQIAITGTTNYDGNYVVEVVGINNLDFRHPWKGDDATGTWTKYKGITRRARSKPLSKGGQRINMSELLLQMEAGAGLPGITEQATSQVPGDDPEVMVRYSDNAGNDWSNERKAKIGQVGEYETVSRLNRLGQFRERTIEIAVSDPIRAVVKGAFADMEILGK